MESAADPHAAFPWPCAHTAMKSAASLSSWHPPAYLPPNPSPCPQPPCPRHHPPTPCHRYHPCRHCPPLLARNLPATTIGPRRRRPHGSHNLHLQPQPGHHHRHAHQPGHRAGILCFGAPHGAGHAAQRRIRAIAVPGLGCPRSGRCGMCFIRAAQRRWGAGGRRRRRQRMRCA